MTVEDTTTARFVETGLRLLIDQPRGILDRGLRSEDVINGANGSHATFYRRFPSKAAYLAQVVDGLVALPRYTSQEIQSIVAAELTANGGLTRPAIRSLVTSHFAHVTDLQSVTKRLLAHIFAGSTPRTTHPLRTDYHRRDQLALAAFDASFGRFGATLRKPFTAATFATAVTAVVEGFALRSRIDPKSVTPALLADTLLTFLGATVDMTQQHGHVDDTLSALDLPPSTPRPPARDPRAAMIAAARDEFAKRGYFMTRIETIAVIAAVPLETARKLFPTKPHILVGALRSHIAAMTEAVADDLLIGLDEIEIVENHLLRCARVAVEETAFMDALVAAVAHDTYSEPEGLLSIKQQLNLPAIIAPVIQQGQDKGVLTSCDAPIEIAAGITNTLLLRCFTRRTHTPEDNAMFISRLVLHGMRTR